MTHHHPLHGDHLNIELFRYLCRLNRITDSGTLPFLVPDTVVFNNARATQWFSFDAESGTLGRRPSKQLDRQVIYSEFSQLQKGDKSEICACFTTFHDCKLQSLYFTAKTLHAFLFGPSGGPSEELQQLTSAPSSGGGGGSSGGGGSPTSGGGGDSSSSSSTPRIGILQKFIEPGKDQNEVFQVAWSPRMTYILRRYSKCRLIDRLSEPLARAATFDGPSTLSEEVYAGPGTKSVIEPFVKLLVDHIRGADSGRYTVGRCLLFFKVDRQGQMWFLYCTSMRIVVDEEDRSALHREELGMMDGGGGDGTLMIAGGGATNNSGGGGTNSSSPGGAAGASAGGGSPTSLSPSGGVGAGAGGGMMTVYDPNSGTYNNNDSGDTSPYSSPSSRRFRRPPKPEPVTTGYVPTMAQLERAQIVPHPDSPLAELLGLTPNQIDEMANRIQAANSAKSNTAAAQLNEIASNKSAYRIRQPTSFPRNQTDEDRFPVRLRAKWDRAHLEALHFHPPAVRPQLEPLILSLQRQENQTGLDLSEAWERCEEGATADHERLLYLLSLPGPLTKRELVRSRKIGQPGVVQPPGWEERREQLYPSKKRKGGGAAAASAGSPSSTAQHSPTLSPTSSPRRGTTYSHASVRSNSSAGLHSGGGGGDGDGHHHHHSNSRKIIAGEGISPKLLARFLTPSLDVATERSNRRMEAMEAKKQELQREQEKIREEMKRIGMKGSKVSSRRAESSGGGDHHHHHHRPHTATSSARSVNNKHQQQPTPEADTMESEHDLRSKADDAADSNTQHNDSSTASVQQQQPQYEDDFEDLNNSKGKNASSPPRTVQRTGSVVSASATSDQSELQQTGQGGGGGGDAPHSRTHSVKLDADQLADLNSAASASDHHHHLLHPSSTQHGSFRSRSASEAPSAGAEGSSASSPLVTGSLRGQRPSHVSAMVNSTNNPSQEASCRSRASNIVVASSSKGTVTLPPYTTFSDTFIVAMKMHAQSSLAASNRDMRCAQEAVTMINDALLPILVASREAVRLENRFAPHRLAREHDLLEEHHTISRHYLIDQTSGAWVLDSRITEGALCSGIAIEKSNDPYVSEDAPAPSSSRIKKKKKKSSGKKTNKNKDSSMPSASSPLAPVASTATTNAPSPTNDNSDASRRSQSLPEDEKKDAPGGGGADLINNDTFVLDDEPSPPPPPASAKDEDSSFKLSPTNEEDGKAKRAAATAAAEGQQQQDDDQEEDDDDEEEAEDEQQHIVQSNDQNNGDDVHVCITVVNSILSSSACSSSSDGRLTLRRFTDEALSTFRHGLEEDSKLYDDITNFFGVIRSDIVQAGGIVTPRSRAANEKLQQQVLRQQQQSAKQVLLMHAPRGPYHVLVPGVPRSAAETLLNPKAGGRSRGLGSINPSRQSGNNAAKNAAAVAESIARKNAVPSRKGGMTKPELRAHIACVAFRTAFGALEEFKRKYKQYHHLLSAQYTFVMRADGTVGQEDGSSGYLTPRGRTWSEEQVFSAMPPPALAMQTRDNWVWWQRRC